MKCLFGSNKQIFIITFWTPYINRVALVYKKALRGLKWNLMKINRVMDGAVGTEKMKQKHWRYHSDYRTGINILYKKSDGVIIIQIK